MAFFSVVARVASKLVWSSLVILIGVLLEFPCCAQQPSTLSRQFEDAERLFWLDNWVKARNTYAACEKGFAVSNPSKALICKFSRLRADAESRLSYSIASRMIAQDLLLPLAQKDPHVRLRGLIVKATADLSIHDPTLSGREWEEVRMLAHSLNEAGWEERAEGELGIVAYLKGDTQTAIALNTGAFEKAKKLNDVAGMIRMLSLKGVGLLERNSPDHALPFFDRALDLAKQNPDARFPLMAYMGKSQALEMLGNDKASGRMLDEARDFVERTGPNWLSIERSADPQPKDWKIPPTESFANSTYEGTWQQLKTLAERLPENEARTMYMSVLGPSLAAAWRFDFNEATRGTTRRRLQQLHESGRWRHR